MKVAPPFELPHLYVKVSRKLNKGVANEKKITKTSLVSKMGSFDFVTFHVHFCVIPSYVCLETC